jgi:8-oxo-dGTP pyrophosphatase MutT (NUDIX family)
MNPQEVQIQRCLVSALTRGEVIVWTVSDAPAEPRLAATLILLRRGDKHAAIGVEVLMVRRAESQSFMPGVWVCPGGVVEPDEELEACAARELEEETGISLEAGPELLPWTRWITPEVVPVRFDTYFFVGLAPPHAPPQPDGREVDAAGWYSPSRALEANRSGGFELVFPTIKTLETLVAYETADRVIEAARGRVIEPILPRVVGTRESHRVLLPGDEGYEDRVTDVSELPG